MSFTLDDTAMLKDIAGSLLRVAQALEEGVKALKVYQGIGWDGKPILGQSEAFKGAEPYWPSCEDDKRVYICERVRGCDEAECKHRVEHSRSVSCFNTMVRPDCCGVCQPVERGQG